MCIRDRHFVGISRFPASGSHCVSDIDYLLLLMLDVYKRQPCKSKDFDVDWETNGVLLQVCRNAAAWGRRLFPEAVFEVLKMCIRDRLNKPQRGNGAFLTFAVDVLILNVKLRVAIKTFANTFEDTCENPGRHQRDRVGYECDLLHPGALSGGGAFFLE